MPSTARDSIDWLRRLGMVAEALTGDVPAQEVAEIVLHQGMAGLGASGAVVVFRQGNLLVPVAMTGTTEETIRRTAPLTIDRQLPMCHAVLHGEEVWITSREEGLRRFPNLRNSSPTSQGWAVAPLAAAGRPFGAFSLVFEMPPDLDAVERQFVQALTGLAALALSHLTRRTHRPERSGSEHERIGVELIDAMLSAPADGVMAVDADGIIVRVSQQICALFGYEAGDLEGQPVEILLPESLRARHVAERRRYAVEPGPRPLGSGLQLVGRRADGSEIPLDVSLSPCTTSNGLHVIAVVHPRPGYSRTIRR